MEEARVEEWYARPVLFASDIDRTLDFYVNRLGFTQGGRLEEQGKALVGQVDRQGCALIFSSQWPDKVGKGLIFNSLNVDVALDKLRAEVEVALDKLGAEFESKGVNVEDTGSWSFAISTETNSVLTPRMPTKYWPRSPTKQTATATTSAVGRAPSLLRCKVIDCPLRSS